jgi:hypothetical protein
MNTDLEQQLRRTLAERHAALRVADDPTPDVLRRARRRAIRNTIVAPLALLALLGVSVAAVTTLFQTPSDHVIGRDPIVLPSEGPAPGETSLVLDSGEIDGEPWTLRLTDSASGLGLSFEWDRLGGGGGGLDRMRQGDLFQGYGGSPSLEFPPGDRSRPLPRAVSGQVTADAERVELRLEAGPTVEAGLYPLPEELLGPAKVFLLFAPTDVLVFAGDLVAFDAAGEELGREYFDLSPVSLFPKVLEESTPDAIAVMKQLQLAGAIVGRYFDEHGSYSGLDPASASTIAPSVVFNTSPVAVPGEVSIRVDGPQSLVLASATPKGDVYSVCMSGGGASVYGRNDTSDSSGCSNGWLEPSGPPLDDGGQIRIATGEANGNLWSLTLVPMHGPDDEVHPELELLLGPIGANLPLRRLGGEDLGSMGAVPPSAVPVNAPAVPGLPTAVDGIASGRVARVELRVDGGGTYEAMLYPVDSDLIDAEQAFLFLVPIEGPMTATVVAFDATGNELDRARVESSG